MHVSGINNTGTINAHNFNSTVITGNHNNQNPQEPNQPGASSINPTEIRTLREKVTNKLRRLKLAGASNPHEEFCRPKITAFCSETTNPDILADKLYEAGTLSKQDVNRVKSNSVRYDKNDALYDLVVSKRALFNLLEALKTSGNENILKLIEELADS
ncbi:unnamed protein product [Allacma fusca]|uniref:CARD domain-containing protein n=1 Tax=Allacma fusca TaxID=39272 RepID=A0A8J2L8B5_9HEXA|nr:unnamed protein product [Allacma fusca]